MSGYLPEERDVRDRVDKGRARAQKHPYSFTDPDHLSADSLEVHQKLIERTARTGGLFCCYLCGEEIFTRNHWHLDHVVPLILRGPHATDNLEAACDVCNLSKGDIPLERFLGPVLHAKFMAGGGLPPFKAMRDRPTAELWARSPEVARRFARRPREVRVVSWGDQWFDPWTGHEGLDARIAAMLMSRPVSEWHKAMSLEQLRIGLGFVVVNNLNDNYWLRVMGLNDRAGKPSYHDNRLSPSPLIVPMQMGKRARIKGFKLRGGPLHGSVLPDLVVHDNPARRFRDQDEIAVFT